MSDRSFRPSSGGLRALGALLAALALLLGPAPVQAQPQLQDARATLAPSERQWIAPGTSATWSITLPPNQRGFWQMLSGAYDDRLFVVATSEDGTPLTCEAGPPGRIACYDIPGGIASFTIRVFAAADAPGLVADIPFYVSDVDRGGGGILVGDLRLRLAMGTPPPTPMPSSTPTSTPGGGGGTPDCSSQPLVFLDGVTNQGGRDAYNHLAAPAAASFQAVRREIITRTGVDAFAVLGDVLRHPSFTTSKAGVANRSWHKAGRAIDLNQGGPFQVRAEGRMFRLFVGAVDITAIFEAHGWNRIPAQGDVPEWWHYEYHPDGISWTSAMAQVWPLDVLQTAFPKIDWAAVGCTAAGGPADPVEEEAPGCVPDPPHWTEEGVAYGRGCGPPILPPGTDTPTGTRLRQFEGVVGWLGDTGDLRPPGPAGVHLHLGLDTGTWTDMCQWPYQVANVPPGEPPPGGTSCMTTWADPVQFLPQANGDTLVALDGTPVPAAAGQVGDPTYGDAYVQLPPPGHPAGLLWPPADPEHPGGTWWSPGNDDRANNARCPLGGPSTTNWLTWLLTIVFPWLFGC